MKVMTALAVFVLSTGLAWSAAEPEKKAAEKSVAEKSAVEKKVSEKKAPEKQVSEKREPSPAQKAQQEKMRTCNADARKQELKGDERKKFMSNCLKKKDQ